MNQHDRRQDLLFTAITAIACASALAYLLWQLFIR